VAVMKGVRERGYLPAPEIIPQEEVLGVDQLPGQLLDDYRLSFRYSVGSEKNQHVIFAALALRYRQQGCTSEQLRTAVQDIPNEVWAAKARPPRQHEEVDQEHFVRETENEKRKFIAMLQNTEGAEDLYVDMLSAINYDALRKDLLYLHIGRPERKSPTARYASFVRDYVLESSPAGSPTFNALFRDMRKLMIHYPPSDLPKVATVWRYRHGDEFYPPDFLAEAEEANTRSAFIYSPLNPFEN
jgi:hypothetical protein